MNAANVSLINALCLIAFGLWGYFGVEDPSKTALIPVGFGVVLLALNPGVRRHNKLVAHIAVGLTLVILVSLAVPLRGAIIDGRTTAAARVGVMLLTSAAAMVFFVKSFIDARRSRTESAGTDG